MHISSKMFILLKSVRESFSISYNERVTTYIRNNYEKSINFVENLI